MEIAFKVLAQLSHGAFACIHTFFKSICIVKGKPIWIGQNDMRDLRPFRRTGDEGLDEAILKYLMHKIKSGSGF
ncbi:hypothetical protein DXT76_06560 [Halobacillus trueperi]|uniref:Uncharacterized protein n=1 Tax=Halobacillus trueperi TaxID=156205 RepID=A0A3D8VQQ8_9BACI|nr:hypothetical protein DXT76_06560 [Halobacillus trueperi]